MSQICESHFHLCCSRHVNDVGSLVSGQMERHHYIYFFFQCQALTRPRGSAAQHRGVEPFPRGCWSPARPQAPSPPHVPMTTHSGGSFLSLHQLPMAAVRPGHQHEVFHVLASPQARAEPGTSRHQAWLTQRHPLG